MLNIDGAQRATLRAALHHYLQDEQGEPENRTDAVHDLATAGGSQISLDDTGIEVLAGLIERGACRAGPLPETDEDWAALASDRRWSEAMLAHARGASDAAYDNEALIELPGEISLHIPAYPLPCDYLRVVDRTVGAAGVELAYWNSDEWRDAPEEVIGAVMGLAKHFQPQLAMQLQQLRVPPITYERTASIGEIARYVASLATGEELADEELAEKTVKARFPMEVWRYEVGNDDTTLGYWEWALHRAEEELADLDEERTRCDVERAAA